MSSRFSYVKYDESAVTAQNAIRAAVERIEALLDTSAPSISDLVPAIDETHLLLEALETGRAKSRATDKLDALQGTIHHLSAGAAHFIKDEWIARAFDLLEECYMWCGKSIRDSQIKRTGKIDEMQERGE